MSNRGTTGLVLFLFLSSISSSAGSFSSAPSSFGASPFRSSSSSFGAGSADASSSSSRFSFRVFVSTARQKVSSSGGGGATVAAVTAAMARPGNAATRPSTAPVAASTASTHPSSSPAKTTTRGLDVDVAFSSSSSSVSRVARASRAVLASPVARSALSTSSSSKRATQTHVAACSSSTVSATGRYIFVPSTMPSRASLRRSRATALSAASSTTPERILSIIRKGWGSLWTPAVGSAVTAASRRRPMATRQETAPRASQRAVHAERRWRASPSPACALARTPERGNRGGCDKRPREGDASGSLCPSRAPRDRVCPRVWSNARARVVGPKPALRSRQTS